MPELKNSNRVMYNATHVAVIPDVNGMDREAVTRIDRAVTKAGFAHTLRIHQSELRALRIALKEQTSGKADGKAVNQALPALTAMVEDSSPMAIFNHAGEFAPIPPEALVKVGNPARYTY